MFAVQGFDVGGIALDTAVGEAVFPFGMLKQFNQIGAFCHHFFQHGFGFACQFVGRADHAERAGVVAEGNRPKPHVAVLRVGGDEDFVAVEARIGGDVVGDAGEVCHARRQVRGRFQIQQAWQHTAVAAGIQYEAGGEFVFLARVGFHAQPRRVAAVVKRGYAVPEAHFHALFGGFVNQDFVKHFAAHLEHRARAV